MKTAPIFHARQENAGAAEALRHFDALAVAVDIVDISAVMLGECLAEVLAFSDKLADRKPRYIKPLDALAGDKINAPAFADIIGEKGLGLGKKVSGSVSNTTLCIGSKVIAASWMLTSSASA